MAEGRTVSATTMAAVAWVTPPRCSAVARASRARPPAAIQKEIRAHQMEWMRVDCRAAVFPDEAQAREAALEEALQEPDRLPEASGPRGLPEAIAGLPVHVGLGKDDQVGLMHLGLAHDPVPLGLIAGVPSFSFKAVGIASPNIQIAAKVPGLPPQGARVTGFPDSNGVMRPFVRSLPRV